MSNKKITELPQATSVSANDILVVVTNPETLAITQRASVNTFFSNTVVGALTLQNKQTPANSSITIAGGRIFFDDQYLYVATSNNVVKRILLEAF